jgi:hypothetical protein
MKNAAYDNGFTLPAARTTHTFLLSTDQPCVAIISFLLSFMNSRSNHYLNTIHCFHKQRCYVKKNCRFTATGESCVLLCIKIWKRILFPVQVMLATVGWHLKELWPKQFQICGEMSAQNAVINVIRVEYKQWKDIRLWTYFHSSPSFSSRLLPTTVATYSRVRCRCGYCIRLRQR